VRVPSLLIGSVALLAATLPFWDSKPPGDWTLDEARTLLTDSPWAQRVAAGRHSSAPLLDAYVATAEPVEKAEDRIRAARKVVWTDPSWDEYREYMTENAGKFIVLAVSAVKPEAFLDAVETKRMEEESRLRIGRRKYEMAGYFPPSGTDPFVRLVFPKDVRDGDRVLTFELYVPGSGAPYRIAEFQLRDMRYHGQPSY
jgi:hypothetical protein